MHTSIAQGRASPAPATRRRHYSCTAAPSLGVAGLRHAQHGLDELALPSPLAEELRALLGAVLDGGGLEPKALRDLGLDLHVHVGEQGRGANTLHSAYHCRQPHALLQRCL
jgi:hypothetical protein